MDKFAEGWILILGKGEIARQLSRLAALLEIPQRVVEPGASEENWPDGVEVVEQIYADAPFPLPLHTHAVIARGHEGDAESVAALLAHGAERVYLIASARRTLAVIEAVLPKLTEPDLLSRLCAPAGLDLGGRSSAEIALSILAEIQLHRYGGSGKPLTELREERAQRPATVRDDAGCPGKRK